MKMLSASDAKSGCMILRNDIPRSGTRTRELYDLFVNSRGVPIKYHKSKGDSPLMSQLVDRYGLDIRNIDRSTWVLAGEWFGKNYVDYVAAVVTGEAA